MSLQERYEQATRQGMAPIEGVRFSKGGKPYVVEMRPVGGTPYVNVRWNDRKHRHEDTPSRGESVVDYHSCIRLVGRLVGDWEYRQAQAQAYHVDCVQQEGWSLTWEQWASRVFV